MKGKLIVIEGLDGCGKSTQAPLVAQALKDRGFSSEEVSFPTYDADSSAMIKSYLNGEFGTDPSDVNCYAASLFFTVDRFAGYKRYWKDKYENGSIIVAARYTTSNMIHQMSKLPEDEWESYLSWLADVEYSKVAIPQPDAVIFLDMPIEASQKLMTGRYSGDDNKKDIHERNRDYLSYCRKAAGFAAEHQGWIKICCAKEDQPLSVNEILGLIMNEIDKIV